MVRTFDLDLLALVRANCDAVGELKLSSFPSLADLPECKNLMVRFIAKKPDVWMEDIGEENDSALFPLTTATLVDITP